MKFIWILIVSIALLIVWQCVSFVTKGATVTEGMTTATETKEPTYQPYNMNDPNSSLILAQQNAGNIEVLKGRVDKIDEWKTKVDGMQQSIDSLQVQVDSLVQQQADYAKDLAGDEPIEVTGV